VTPVEHVPSNCFIQLFRAVVSVLVGPCCPALLNFIEYLLTAEEGNTRARVGTSKQKGKKWEEEWEKMSVFGDRPRSVNEICKVWFCI